VESVRIWLEHVRQDELVAKLLLERRPPLVGPALFHTQQLAEKAMKAFLTFHGEPFRRSPVEAGMQRLRRAQALLAAVLERLPPEAHP
jgi:HEPN domain-containing protein